MKPTEESKNEPVRGACRKAKKKGLVIVNTGEGKGKTTAALGLMTRAWGRQMRVAMLQFIKHENANFGEHRAAEKMGIDVIPMGKGWTWKMRDEQSRKLALDAWEQAKKLILNDEHDILVLDEFTYLLAYEWLDTGEVIEWLGENKPEMMHLVLTGRYAPDALIEFADLVTEMKMIKHPLKSGIRGQPGIEF